MRLFFASLTVMFFSIAGVSADEIKGSLAKVEDAKITLTIDGADKTFDVSKDVKVVAPGKKNKIVDLPGLSSLKVGDDVTLTTETVDEKTVVTKVLAPAQKKKKKTT
jgi:hypothetical protein